MPVSPREAVVVLASVVMRLSSRTEDRAAGILAEWSGRETPSDVLSRWLVVHIHGFMVFPSKHAHRGFDLQLESLISFCRNSVFVFRDWWGWLC